MDVSETFRCEKGAEESMKKSILKDTLALVAITLVAALFLAVVYEVTRDTIAVAEETERMDSFRAVYPTAADFKPVSDDLVESFNESHEGAEIQSCFNAMDAAGNPEGIVLSVVSHSGYGGDVVLSLGVKLDGTILGMKVTSMSETSGLGANCQNE